MASHSRYFYVFHILSLVHFVSKLKWASSLSPQEKSARHVKTSCNAQQKEANEINETKDIKHTKATQKTQHLGE